MSTQITKNFTLEELTYSSSGRKAAIDNTPSNECKQRLYTLVNRILQPVRDKYGKSVTVTSGYRSPELNAYLKGAKGSQHMKGEAADLKCSDNKALFDTILAMVESGEIEVGQLIWEFGNDLSPAWVHVSLPYAKKNQILVAKKLSGKTYYFPYRKG